MKWMIWLTGTTMLLCMGTCVFYSRGEHAFANLTEAQSRIFAAGFQCTSDLADGRLVTGFLISREAVSWNEVGMLSKAADVGPKWKGKVWVTINPLCFQLGQIPDHGGARMWGKLVAFGDEELLNEIDHALDRS